ncbi:unnamed protein product, partial [Meganyctiphanes norvegica]
MMAMLQQLLGLVLILSLVEAQNSIAQNDDLLQRNGNWSIDPRASGTYSCSRRPRLVTLNPGDVATFTSPGYPSPYSSRNSCGWKFRTSQSSDLITITCSSFTVQSPSRGRCRDYLALGRGKYCGSNGPVGVTVSRYLKLWFKSDRRNNFAGFSCTATVAGTVVTTAAPVVTTAAPVVTTVAPVVSGRCVCGTVNRGSRIVGGVTTE